MAKPTMTNPQRAEQTQAVSDSDTYKVLIEGTNLVTGLYYVWTTSSSGSIQSGSGWKDG